MTPEQLAALRAAAEKATPGPWQWHLNESSKSVHINGGRPMFDKTVMCFERWGMHSAAPLFNDAQLDGDFNIMERVEKYGEPAPGREHHASWFKDVQHPDAQFMVTANPATILALLDHIAKLEAGREAAVADVERHRTVLKEFGSIIQDLTVAMQSAIIEWKHGKGGEAGLQWIANTLIGPGHYPVFDAEHGKNAQFWYDTHCSNPMPKCFCGNPSHIVSMDGGFCCDEHAAEAKAKRAGAPASAKEAS